MAEAKNDFTKGSVSGAITRMALPMTAAQLVNILYNIVDRMYIGRLPGVGRLALTGVGVCTVRVLWILFALPHFHTMLGAAFCYPLTWTLTTVAFIIYYYFFSTLRRVKVKVWKPFGRRR